MPRAPAYPEPEEKPAGSAAGPVLAFTGLAGATT
jgi:hypothetical protein